MSWFSTWFDSPYYGILYCHRDEQEASQFIHRVIGVLGLAPGDRVLDLACGRGRHSITLHREGMEVTGIDLSASSIEIARESEQPGLKFYIADMRSFDLDQRYKAIFNLFTSFGYFETIGEHEDVLNRVWHHMAPDGWFVLDFLCDQQVRRQLIPEETVDRGEVRFIVRKSIEHGRVIKTVEVIDRENTYTFEEKVWLFSQAQLEEMLNRSGLNVVHRFGNYNLDPFDPDRSDRCILVARRS